jgi:predicted nucleic acid-binding protein
VERQVIPRLAVLPYGVNTARLFGELAAGLGAEGRTLADADLQIAATALQHGLALVTGNLRHFERIPGLVIEGALADARGRS